MHRDEHPHSRPRFELEFTDCFSGPSLDENRWVSHYLPHWTTPRRSAARFDLGADGLRLRIDADQPPWRPDDGPMRVSNVQTGTWSGPPGSFEGQHRQQAGPQVRTAQPSRHLWTPTYGRVEVAARASADPDCMLGIWLVGFEEDSPTHSGEICIAELFGNATSPTGSTVRLGVKAHHDPRLRTEMHDVVLPVDTTEEHTYAAEWDSLEVRILVDGDLLVTSHQRIAYPLQLMIDLFEFPTRDRRNPDDYPKTGVIRCVRGYRAVPATTG